MSDSCCIVTSRAHWNVLRWWSESFNKFQHESALKIVVISQICTVADSTRSPNRHELRRGISKVQIRSAPPARPVLAPFSRAPSGRQRRRALGYSVVPLLRELQIFRRVLTSMVQEIVGAQVSAEQIERGRDLIIDIVDRSMNISILQYTLAAEEERNSAQGEARELHEQRYPGVISIIVIHSVSSSCPPPLMWKGIC
jgi:hypothetical protein